MNYAQFWVSIFFGVTYVALQILGNLSGLGNKRWFHMTSAMIVLVGGYIGLPRSTAVLFVYGALTTLAALHLSKYFEIKRAETPMVKLNRVHLVC